MDVYFRLYSRLIFAALILSRYLVLVIVHKRMTALEKWMLVLPAMAYCFILVAENFIFISEEKRLLITTLGFTSLLWWDMVVMIITKGRHTR